LTTDKETCATKSWRPLPFVFSNHTKLTVFFARCSGREVTLIAHWKKTIYGLGGGDGRGLGVGACLGVGVGLGVVVGVAVGVTVAVAVGVGVTLGVGVIVGVPVGVTVGVGVGVTVGVGVGPEGVMLKAPLVEELF
jgi:hypothetical protein